MKSTKIVSLIMAMLMLAVTLTGCAGANKPQTNATAVPTAEAAQTEGSSSGLADVKLTCVNEAGQSTPITVYSAAALAGQTFEYDSRYTVCSNTFAAKMTEAVAAGSDNWTGVYSPLSLQMVLQMLANGGDEATAQALLAAVCEGMTRDDVNKSAAKLLTIFNSLRGITMNSAVIVNDDYRVRQDYADSVGTYYRAGVGTVDLADAKAAEQQINDWISERTNGLINNLVDDLSYDTVMLLLNVLTFDLNWAEPFMTFRGLSEFAGANGNEWASMMKASGEYLYGSFEEGQMAFIPYKNSDYAMAVILPEKGFTPAQAVSALLSRREECEMTPGTVSMPKIKLDTKLDVMGLVSAMGLDEAIGGNYTGLLADGADAAVSRILQGAVIDVNEYGTTAAAATSVELNKSATLIDEKFSMTCDRPYAMVIYNVQTGTVMFVSLVNDVA